MLSDAWLGAVVCESNMMITMTNNLLCILHDVGYIQILDFSETIAASDLKVSWSRHLIEYMKICEKSGTEAGTKS